MNTATEVLSEFGINVMSLNDEFNTQLLHAMQQYAEQHCELLKNNYIYWESRCQAAEEVMETIPPDVNWGNLGAIEDHEKAYMKWLKLKSTPIPIQTPCVELEKEVERLKGLIENAWLHGFNNDTDITMWETFKTENNL